MLPDGRWPAAVDMKGRAAFKGDTITFAADTAGSACQTADARYVVSRTDDQLHVAGLGMDSCGGPACGAGGNLGEGVKSGEETA